MADGIWVHSITTKLQRMVVRQPCIEYSLHIDKT
ncbi:MAG: hypothetical protein ACI9JZ_000786 [Lentimonas sp.]|jgi:hypothetical protein